MYAFDWDGSALHLFQAEGLACCHHLCAPPRRAAAPCCCRDRLLYTLVCLAIFLVCSQLPLYGVKTTSGAGACIGDLCK